MRHDFVTLDVFTDRRFGGNPLAVVFDPQATLDTTAMQAIAREFNLSETTFVRPPRNPQHDAEVRIFTPASEMPWAGHPNVGTAWALACAPHRLARAPHAAAGGGQGQGLTLHFDEGAGPVEARIALDADGRPTRVDIRAPLPLQTRAAPSAAALARCVGLEVQDLQTTGPQAAHGPVVATVGFPFPFVELQSRAALAAARPQAAAMDEHLVDFDLDGVVLWCRETIEADRFGSAGPVSTDLSARMFAPMIGVPEDPATGSAMAALAAWIARTEGKAAATLSIAQGVDMGRPSRIHTQVGPDGVWVGGACVPVMSGQVES